MAPATLQLNAPPMVERVLDRAPPVSEFAVLVRI